MQSSSSFIDDLRPREKRYDLEIDPNLFISVLPNGVKTWVLCDMVLGKPRRKTLGVYPQMSLSAARDAVENTSGTGYLQQPAADDPPMPVKKPAPAPSPTIRDGRIVPASTSRWPLIAAAATGLAVVVAAAFFWIRSGSEAVIVQSPPAASAPPAVETQKATPPVESLIDPVPLPAREAGPVTTQVPEPTPAAAIQNPVLAAAATAVEPVVETPEGKADDNTAVIDASPADPPAPAEPARLAGTVDSTAQQPAPPAAANSMSAGAATDIPQTPAPPRGVARFQLTSEIRAREPTDDLQQTVNGGGADLRRVYFFTDLRGLTGESVTHRWLHNGALSAAVVFDVGGWRWRVYSSKDLLPGQAGDWTVEVVGSAGELLATHSFSYFP